MKFGTIVLQVYSSIDGVEFPISRHTFKMAAMTSFHAEKYCHQVSVHEAYLPGASAAASASF